MSTNAADPTPQPAEVALLTRLPSWVLHGGAGPAAGRLYLVLIGAVVVVTDVLMSVLGDDHGRTPAGPLGADTPLADEPTGYALVIGVSVAMAVLLACSWAVPWRRLPRWSAVAFPVVVLGALVALGAAPHALGPTLEALIALTFVYAGLFLGMREAAALLPLAWAAYLALAPELEADALVRALTYSLPWLATAYFLQLVSRANRWQRDALRRAATTDALTGLPNRRLVDERLAALRPGDSVVVCDLDRFKQLNDTRGHQAGDVVLVAFASALAAGLRPTDFAGRLGGEEFVLVLPATDLRAAAAHVDRIRADWAAGEPLVTFSAGVAEAGDEAGADVLARADRALYRAKRAGRDRVDVAGMRGPARRGAAGSPSPVGGGSPARPQRTRAWSATNRGSRKPSPR